MFSRVGIDVVVSFKKTELARAPQEVRRISSSITDCAATPSSYLTAAGLGCKKKGGLVSLSCIAAGGAGADQAQEEEAGQEVDQGRRTQPQDAQ